MILENDYKCGLTPERQIADGLAVRVLTGQLRPGDRLPAVQDLALQLRVNPHAVARAYALVAETGLVHSAGGEWTAASPAGDLTAFRADLIGRLLQRALSQARTLEVPRAAVAERFAALLEEHYGRD